MAVTSFNKSTYLQENPEEEQQLLQRLADGEIKAFWPLWQKYQDYLFRCCLRWKNGNKTEAEDLLSQAMLKAMEKVQNYAGKIANFKSWVTALVRNFWLDMQRRPCAKQVEDIEVYAERDELGLVSVDDIPASALEREEKKMVIRCAIDELPTKMRESFILHFYEEMSNQEIAEMQGISYANVCKRISQARAILAKKLRVYFFGAQGSEPESPKVPTKPGKSKKPAKPSNPVEPLVPDIETIPERIEKDEYLSPQEIGEPQEISCQNVAERICEVPAILEAEDGTIMELAVMPVGRELGIEEMSQGNGELSPDVGAKHIAFGMASLTGEESMTQNQRFAIRRRSLLEEYASPSHWERLNRNTPVEPVVGVAVILSVAVAEVGSVAGEELPVVAVSEQQSESDSVAAASEEKLSQFNFIGKQVVGAVSRWLHCFGGSQLFYGIAVAT